MVSSRILEQSLGRSTAHFTSTFVEELAKSTVKAIRNLFVCEGYDLKKMRGEQDAVDHIIDMFVPLDDGDAVKMVKYLTAIYLPRLVNDEEPPRPEFLNKSSTLFTHAYGYLLEKRLKSRAGKDTVRHKPSGLVSIRSSQSNPPSKRQLAFAFSILQIKRYLPPLSEKLKREAKLGCKERLCKPGETPDFLLDQVARTVEELFPMGWDRVPEPKYTVTNKSCFEYTRGQGGSQAYMFSRKLRLEQVTEKGFDFGSVDDLIHSLPQHPAATDPETYLDEACSTQPQVLKAKMEIVDDPLKARVITKNNWQCTVLKPLQKMIHNRLREHPAFELIGKMCDEKIMEDIVHYPGSRFVSGDYEAATDNFHSDVTDVALETILNNMTGRYSRNPEFIYLAKRSLTGLTIYDEELGEFVMQRGQLMGSLLSFPILCMVNFAIWRHTCEQVHLRACDGLGKGGDPDHVKINGDDIAFCATPRQYEFWKEHVPLVGLKPSVGKNYYTSHFCTINTLLFIPDDTGRLKLKRFLNQGLLKPPGDGESTLDKQECLGAMHDLFVAGASAPGVAAGVFINHHKKLLKMTWRNLYGSRFYGGLGAHPVPGTKHSLSFRSYSLRQLVVYQLIKKSIVSMPKVGLQARFEKFQGEYLSRLFPNAVQVRPDDESLFWSTVKCIEPMVEGKISDLRSHVSWIAPYYFSKRGAEWSRLNKVATKADYYIQWKGRKMLDRLDDGKLWDLFADPLQEEYVYLTGDTYDFYDDDQVPQEV